MKQIISSLDLGSNSIKMVVGEIVNNNLYVLANSEVKSKGIKQGIIINEEEAISSIKKALKRCEEMLNIKINKVILTVAPYNAMFIKSEGYTLIDNDKNIVSGSDITKALQASVYNHVTPNYELVSVTPLCFTLDNNEVVKNPKEMVTTRLTVNSILGVIPKKNVDKNIEVLEKLNIKVVDLAFGSLADYYEFKTKNIEDKTVATINIGEYKTEIGIISEGVLLHSDVLDIAGRNIDRDISYIYDISLDDAKKLKEEFAIAHKSKASTSEVVEVITKNDEKIKINQYEISEIVYSRIREILETVKKSINVLTKEDISYIIITGGSTEIEGFPHIYAEIFGKTNPPTNTNDIGVRNNKFSTSLGVIKLYNDKLVFREKIAYTVDEDEQDNILNNKKKINESSLLGKVYSYFFDN